MEDYFILEGLLHVDKFSNEEFKILSEENSHILDDIEVSFDGTILAVKKEKVLPALKDKDISRMRLGFKKMPRNFEIKTEDDFYNFLALHISLEDYM